MKEVPWCLMGGCHAVDAREATCKFCGFDRTQAKMRAEKIRQNGLVYDPASGLRKLIVKGRHYEQTKV